MDLSYRIIITLLIIVTALSCRRVGNIDISGEWSFCDDPQDLGIGEEWFKKSLNENIYLPGSMAENGFGEEIDTSTLWTGQIVDKSWYTEEKYKKYREEGNIKIPFWLQPDRKYTGAAWYSKIIEIPRGWDKRSILLSLERCHWESRAWIDSIELGMQNTLATPHSYDLTGYATPGKHRLTIRIDNRIKDINPGINSHSITDHTQGNWNGIAGKMEIYSEPLVYIEHVSCFPDINTGTVWLDVNIKNAGDQTVNCLLEVLCNKSDEKKGKRTRTEKYHLSIDPGLSRNSVEFLVGKDVALWDEFSASTYDLDISLDSKNGKSFYSTVLGFRKVETSGGQILINGRPIFLRGTLECSIFPLTGYPPTNEEAWNRIMQIIKKHGLNHIRFHSWCPPGAAFVAADKAGIYLQVECSSWANSGSSIGDGKAIDRWLIEEGESIIRNYGNHPSFIMMAYGNEPAGINQNEYLGEFIDHFREHDRRRIYTSGAGWPLIDKNDYHNSPLPRIQGWGEELKSIINSERPSTDYDWTARIRAFDKPVVSHEIGQWCVYPDFSEINKYTGVLKARNFEIFRETLENNGLEEYSELFLSASGKLQSLCYKAEIEAALRTPGFAGFQLLDLHDFPGQGSALVGVLNAFWGEKGYISPDEFRRFCSELVPLARLDRMVFNNSDTLNVECQASYFGKDDIRQASAYIEIIRGEELIFKRDISAPELKTGSLNKLGVFSIPLHGFEAPAMYTLQLNVEGRSNSWNIWVYPDKNKLTGNNILVTNDLNSDAIKALQRGENVLICTGKNAISEKAGADIGLGFSSIFWNTAWTRGQKPHTLGILCDPSHPALAEFPSRFHSDWQWWDAMSNSSAINMEVFRKKPQTIVRIIDDWFQNRDLALVFEGRCLNGGLIVTGIDLLSNTENRPEAVQLLHSLTGYMSSELFKPEVLMDIQELGSIFAEDKQP